MEPISAWTATAQTELESGTILLEKEIRGYPLKVCATAHSLWVTAIWPDGGRVAFRPVYGATDELSVTSVEETQEGAVIIMEGTTGTYTVTLQLPDPEKPIFRYTTLFRPEFNMLVPYAPRDIVPLTKNGSVQNTAGKVHAHQVGTRSGLLFMSMTRPKTGSVFYFQNLTALADYCQDTETSAGETVGGEWPEIGFRLPQTKGRPIQAGKEYTLSDAFVLLSPDIPSDNFEVTQQFMNHLAEVYLLLPKPETGYNDWPDLLHKGIDDLKNHKGCWKFVGGRSYLNAYVSDYDTPPEIMVQLAALLPLTDYDRWSGEDHQGIIDVLKEGIEGFYDKEMGTIVRWHPDWRDKLDYSEEQKRPEIMDSWYLHHPLMNLSRLALEGDKTAERLLMDSIEYAIKVAHHFDYQWPVFYKMTTLEVVKAETKEGEGGEKDVPGAYAHLMIQVWQLTGEKRYFNEAVRAARKLEGLGFDLFYQANNTAFSAGALLRLYKETGDELFLKLSYVCIASILKNVQLWDCNYGYARQYPTFFAIYPLSDAPYTAAYEEQEVFAGVHSFLREAESIDILPSVRLLVAKFIRYAVHRLCYYYPPKLPKEALSDEVKTGEIDPGLWIALEDLQDGWNKSGQVGQEVYGAGLAFGIVPRQYFKVDKAEFMVFTDYPAINFHKKKNGVSLQLRGDGRLKCRLAVVPAEKGTIPEVTVSIGQGKGSQVVEPAASQGKQKYLCFEVAGNSRVEVHW